MRALRRCPQRLDPRGIHHRDRRRRSGRRDDGPHVGGQPLRIYYDPNPDGTRDFEVRAGWFRGRLVATYHSDEYFAIDAARGVLDTRVAYSFISSEPFTYQGHCVDFSTLAPRG